MQIEAEFLDTKEHIFKRPTTLKEIIKERISFIEIKSFKEIISKLEEKLENQVAIIYPEVDIIPKNEQGSNIYYSAQNFSKRGPLILLNTLNGIQRELKEEKWGALKARIEASKSEKYKNSEEHYIGWLWRDPKGIAHILHPNTVIEGHRINSYARKSRSIEDKITFPKDKEYHARDSNLITVRALVPSRTGKKHPILMENLTYPEDIESYVQWTRFNTRHKCRHKEEDFSFRFKDYITYCPHDVAAHVAYSTKIARETGKIIQQPFPLFREAMLRLYLSLAYDTIKIDLSIKNNKLTTKKRPLTLAEIDPILMRAWLIYGNYNTFYVPAPKQGHKRMIEYNWAISAQGMKFKNE